MPSSKDGRDKGVEATEKRAAHVNARGKKMPTLSDLSRKPPSYEEIDQMFKLLPDETDRGCALVAGSLLESTLTVAVDCFLVNCGGKFRKSLFHEPTAPLGSLSAKIKMAHALGIIDAELMRAFNKVKDIRNAFAHAFRPIDFGTPRIVTEVRALVDEPMPDARDRLSPARIRYSEFCRTYARHLIGAAMHQGIAADPMWVIHKGN